MNILVAMGSGEAKDSFFTPKVIAALEQMGNVIYNETGKPNFTKDELIAHIPEIDVLFSGWGTPCIDADVLKAANKLKIHAHTGGSVASNTSREEYEKGIIVLSGNDLFAQSVAEGCLCYTLSALRRMELYSTTMKTCGWQPEHGQNQGLIGKKIGLVGFGAIARYYAQLLQWFHPELLIASDHITEDELCALHARKATAEEIFETCDVISFHAALNDKTKEMFGADMLARIRSGALFVNLARAGLFNKQALYDQLATGRFSAVLDVYHEEPLPMNSPLRTMENVMLMPHSAGPTFDMREKVALKLIEDVRTIQTGGAPSCEIPYSHAQRMTVK